MQGEALIFIYFYINSIKNTGIIFAWMFHFDKLRRKTGECLLAKLFEKTYLFTLVGEHLLSTLPIRLIYYCYELFPLFSWR